MNLTGLSGASPVYGNRVTGNSGYQINCSGGGTFGAGFNWIGFAASNANGCSDDVDDRLGADWTTWVDNSTTLNQVTLSTAGAIFDLGGGSNPPFGNGVSDADGLGQLVSNFYAIREGTDDATFDPTIDGRLYRIQDVDDCSTSGNTDCWDYDGVNGDPIIRNSAPSGHYVVGSENDPTAIILSDLTVTSARNTWVPATLLVVSVTLIGGLFLARRKREQ